MNVEVLSLGGSLLFKDHKVQVNYLKSFAKLLLSYKNRKFIVVVGGGIPSRMYMHGMEKLSANEDVMGHMGISLTHANATLVAQAFGKHSNHKIPTTISEVKQLLKKHKIVCTGGLTYGRKRTTDTNAVELANLFKTRFVNLTNVDGIYTKDPRKYKDAKLIKELSAKEFYALATKKTFHVGQHSLFDPSAAKLIKQHRVPSYLMGKSLANLKALLNNKSFRGTSITHP